MAQEFELFPINLIKIIRLYTRASATTKDITCHRFTYLDAVGRDDVAESVVVVAEKLGKVVQEDEEDAEGAAVESVHGFGEFRVPQERRQELEQVHQQLRVHRPTLLQYRQMNDEFWSESNQDSLRV